jgi:hypothetical protein
VLLLAAVALLLLLLNTAGAKASTKAWPSSLVLFSLYNAGF